MVVDRALYYQYTLQTCAVERMKMLHEYWWFEEKLRKYNDIYPKHKIYFEKLPHVHFKFFNHITSTVDIIEHWHETYEKIHQRF